MNRISISLLLALGIFVAIQFCFDARSAEPFAKRGPRSGEDSGKTLAPIVPAGPSLVTRSGRQLLVRKRNQDGSLAPPSTYTIRGVAWSPASQNTVNSVASRRAEFSNWKNTDIPLMKAMNINTVYTFFDPGLDANGTAVLDQLYDNGIMVLMTVDEDGGYDLSKIQQVVNFYKNHPAILGWMLGNEWNINLYKGAAGSVADAANKTQSAAQLIKSLDANHPVATSYGDIDINDVCKTLADTEHYVKDVCTSVDFWGLNIYRSNTFGTLFDQWKAITTKPMFLGEFGTDVFRSTDNSTHGQKNGSEDGLMQGHWELTQWNQIMRNLSAKDPTQVSVGGFVFEWNDEWWKIPTDANHPAHSNDGCDFHVCGGHPDQFGNEEYFGIVDINRQTRPVYDLLKMAFAADYQPPQTVTYRAVSRGWSVMSREYDTQAGFVLLFKDGEILYRRDGGDAGALARGFNVAVIDPCSNLLQQQVQHFDTWDAAHHQGSEITQMIDFLDSLPSGVLLMLSVADEGGLNEFDSCTHMSGSEPLIQKLLTLGSDHIDEYCYRNSWAMLVVKGEGVARSELAPGIVEISTLTTLPVPVSISPNGRSFSRFGGAGSLQVTATGNCGWTGSASDSWITITSGGSGSGSGTLNFTVGSNASNGFRTGTIAVGNWLFTIVQSAADTTLRLDNLVPQAGQISGGQQLTLTGAFANLSTVTIGGVAAVWSYTNGPGDTSSITVTTPAHAFGAVQINFTPASGNGLSKPNAFAYLTTVFTDDVINVAQTNVKAQHIFELQQAVDALRAVAGLGPAPWTDPTLLPTTTIIKAVHILELRTYLDDAASRLGYSTSPYTDPSLTTGFVIKRVHIEELRQRIRAIAG